ncbi:MAG: folylpolyglutamate synthase/dihydrofolate synthase family protein [Bdellovibrionota bacterium]|nr:MAG: folylpolyglutamate synthase/dihydrofolate synthase family protein [Bdellovibrionota bacterium]
MTDFRNFLNALPQWSGSGEFSLGCIRTLLAALGDPHLAVPALHVAGTNGKGSVSAALASILGASGKRVGLYTSPHLVTMNERVVIDGLPVDDSLLEVAALRIRAVTVKEGLVPSFFEVMTAIAFWSFRELALDYAVLEVGLGGRLDATNVIDHPLVSVITTISFDHEHVLGDTLAKIAAEKAGIIKPKCPVVSGALPAEAAEVVLAKATELGAPLYRCGSEFSYHTREDGFLFRSGEDELPFTPSLRGSHQGHNMSLAIQAALLIEREGHRVCANQAIQRGVASVFWPARLEETVWRDRPLLIDAGHNPEGIGSLCAYLKSRAAADRRWRAVDCCFGAISTKNWQAMVELLLPHVREWRVLEPAFHKAVSSDEICRFLRARGAVAHDFGTRYAECLSEMDTDVPVLFTGSIYLIGALRDLAGVKMRALWTPR